MRKLEIDMERLALAIADHAKAVSDKKAHRIELENLQTQIRELDDEITRLGIELKSFDLNKDAIGITEIKSFAQKKLKIQYELESLAEVRDALKKKLPIMQRDYSSLDAVSEETAIKGCWTVLYDGLKKSIDVESIKQLLIVGVAAGMSEKMVMDDLNLTVEYERLEPLIKQFCIPVYGRG